MPLHLLGKKSWNVYNTANIEKVRRDEAAAAAREAGEEQRMQEEDAHRRLQLLRGEKIESLARAESPLTKKQQSTPRPGHERKRKRVAGEDDTDRDIRYALEQAKESSRSTAQVRGPPTLSSDAPLLDRAGHINLFPPDKVKHVSRPNAEAEVEAARQKREYEDQYTMRFSNAAGFKQSLDARPWYFDAGSHDHERPEQDSEKSEYEKLRDQRKVVKASIKMAADDPLSAMRQGVLGLREVEKSRQAAKEQRKHDFASINKDLRRRKRHRHHDALDDFHLENSAAERHQSRHHRRHGSSDLHSHRRRHQAEYAVSPPEHRQSLQEDSAIHLPSPLPTSDRPKPKLVGLYSSPDCS